MECCQEDRAADLLETAPLRTKTIGDRTTRSMPLRFVNRGFVEGLFSIFIDNYVLLEHYSFSKARN